MKTFFVLAILFLVVKVQAHTFLPIDTFVEGYESYVKEKNLSIHLATIGAYYKEGSVYENMDYTNSKDPILLGIKEKSLAEKYLHAFRWRDFKFRILNPDNQPVGKILLQESMWETYGSFFYISLLHVEKKHQGKGLCTKALQEFINLFEAVNRPSANRINKVQICY